MKRPLFPDCAQEEQRAKRHAESLVHDCEARERARARGRSHRYGLALLVVTLAFSYNFHALWIAQQRQHQEFHLMCDFFVSFRDYAVKHPRPNAAGRVVILDRIIGELHGISGNDCTDDSAAVALKAIPSR